MAQYQPGSIGVLNYTLIFETLQGVRSSHAITDTIAAVTASSFSFTDVTGAAYSTAYTSNTITVTT
ncbi:hypothetical protein, partial [Staphylococcus aureus]